MIEPLELPAGWPFFVDISPALICALGMMGLALAITLADALFQRLAASDVEPSQAISAKNEPADLIEMVDAEMDEWEAQLAIHYSATLPRELRLDIRQRMIHVGRVMSERKSKSEDMK